MGPRVRSFDLSPWIDRGGFAPASRRGTTRLQADQAPRSYPGCSAFVYRVQQGDTPYLIAQRFGIALSDLLHANPQIDDPRNILTGELLCVPARPSCPQGVDGFVYTVLLGDTFASISETFDLTPEQLAAANPQVQDPNVLYPGEPLCIPRIVGVAYPCCSLLLPTRIEPKDVEAAGAAVIRPVGEEHFEVLFSVVGIPEPGDLGPFDSYAGSLQVRGERYSAVLSRSAPLNQPPTWSGAAVIPAAPTEETELLIVPVDTKANTTGTPIMRGFVSTCGG